MPVHTGEKARKAARVLNELSAQLGRGPTDEEVAKSLGWTSQEVRAVTGLLSDATSLDRPTGSEEGAPKLGELVEDERASVVPDTVIRDMENARLREAIEGCRIGSGVSSCAGTGWTSGGRPPWPSWASNSVLPASAHASSSATRSDG